MNHTRLICVITIAAFALCASSLLSPELSQAKDMKPIAFASGANSASFKGDIQGMDRDIYPITAKAGQTMKITVKNKLKLVLFHVQLPGQTEKYLPGAGEEDDATEWQGRLPTTGTYNIIVGAMRGSDTTYKMELEITN